MRLAAMWMCVLAASTALGCLGRLGDTQGSGEGSGNTPGAGAGEEIDPGRVTIHRLNRAEYNNTVHDLLGTSQSPADDFPSDDPSYGFDNIADSLTMSPTHVELYDRAAELLAEEALSEPVATAKTHYEAESLQGTVGKAIGNAWVLWGSGEIAANAKFPAKGKYRISARVWGQQGGNEPVKLSLLVGGSPIGAAIEVPWTAEGAKVVEQTAVVEEGNSVVTVAFLNDTVPGDTGDRNLFIDWIDVEGPLDVAKGNDLRDRIVACDPSSGEACIRQIVGDFAARAWRRPPSQDEIAKLAGFVKLAQDEGDDINEGLKLAVRATLVSPHFLFRVETDPSPTSIEPHPLNDYEIASRLSYFLWSTMPDDELFQAAADGKLQDEDEIRAQVLRMLDDPRAEAFVENFAGQWLFMRVLASHNPDNGAYPGFDESLRDAMMKETTLFFREFLSEDRSMKEMLTADFTYMNDRLAKHYGLPGGIGPELKRVALKEGKRRGLLTQAALLTVTSHTTRTSPVKRGKWVLEQLLCSAPPPPPPDVEGLPTESVPTGSVRDQLEQHVSNATCAACHKAMDPIGFALENFDGIGSYRTEDMGFPIDASGLLPTGETFNGAQEMETLLAGDERFTSCVARQVFTYALGRAPELSDKPAMNKLARDFEAAGFTLKELLVLVATSEPFRMRRGEPAEQ